MRPTFKGLNGREFKAGLGDWIGDRDGRSGTVVSCVYDDTLKETVFTVDPSVGVMLEVRESLVTFCYIEEEDKA